MEQSITYKQYILPAIIGGLFLLSSVFLASYLNKSENKLSSKEVTETRNHDGTVTKRAMEIYK